MLFIPDTHGSYRDVAGGTRGVLLLMILFTTLWVLPNLLKEKCLSLNF